MTERYLSHTVQRAFRTHGRIRPTLVNNCRSSWLSIAGPARPTFSSSSTTEPLTETSASHTSTRCQAVFSENQPAELPTRLSNLRAWALVPSRMGISRQFTFPTFGAAWSFMTLVADECKIKKHHPSWHNLYNQVTIEWTTHKPKGLSIKDVEMAEFCDRAAQEIVLKSPKSKP
ncbi:pterin 4 alpha carbinolamine dehydratase-domain-containing protein [Dendryphion nanum]|uniref:4a-hydroxytetrahydrobiopterin dehydratase n=1 Tax=Dendryphion nanum TaxID=256645 RepID=A0A9P9IZ53_9PLEO|nr:pterin 4 alpha carbinolamine dehydratase-domain-containing protein [Dendryphion nanum]